MRTYYSRVICKILLALLLLFGGIMRVAYATDTYWVADVGLKAAADDMLFKNGRVLTALVYALCARLGLTIPRFYQLSYLASLLIYLAAILLLDHMTRNLVEDENARLLLCLTLIINPFLVEYYMFIEMFEFAAAIFLAVLGAYCMQRLVRTGHLWLLLPAILSVLGAFMLYQASTGLFIIVAIPYAWHALRRDTTVRGILLYLRAVVLIGVAYLVAAISYILIYERVLHAIRDPGPDDSLMTIVRNVLREEWKALRSTCDILPDDSYLLITAAALLCCLLALRYVQNRVLWILHLLACIGAVAAVAGASVVAGNYYYVARTIYPLGCMACVLLLNAAAAGAPDAQNPDTQTPVADKSTAANEHGNANRSALLPRCAVTLAAVLFLLEIPCFIRIYVSKYRVNYADELRSYAIGEAIAEYEAESGNTITKVAFYQDAAPQAEQYPGLFHAGDMVVSSYTTTWSDDEALNYYLGTDYEKVDPDPEIAAQFAAQDWDAFSAQQMRFEGDTLHYCVY